MSVQEPRRGNGSADESDDLFGDGGGAGPAYLRRAVDGDEVTGSHRSRGLRRPRTDAPARPEKRRTIDLTAVPEARPASSGPIGPDEVSGRLAGIGDRLSGLEANVEQVVEGQERRFRELERRLDSIDASLAHDLPDLVARLGAAAVAVEQTLDEVVAGREALQDGVRRADRAVAGWVEAVRTEAGRLSSAARALGSLGDTVTGSLERWEQEAGGQHRVLLERLVESLVAGSPARYRRRIAERLLATTGHVRPDAGVRVVVAVVVAVVLGVDVVEHRAGDVGTDLLHPLDRGAQLPSARGAGTADEDRDVDVPSELEGVGDGQDRRAVVDHEVRAPQDVALERPHRGRGQQLVRVGRDRAGRQDPQVVDPDR
jgi:hypothetical protein